MTFGTPKPFSTLARAGWILLAILICSTAAPAQPERAATTANALLKKPAKQVFGAVKAPLSMQARAIGSYSKGCLVGAQALPVDGAAWQVMRTSRNRNWAHPAMIALLERFAADAKQYDGWNGLLVGDVAQPR